MFSKAQNCLTWNSRSFKQPCIVASLTDSKIIRFPYLICRLLCFLKSRISPQRVSGNSSVILLHVRKGSKKFLSMLVLVKGIFHIPPQAHTMFHARQQHIESFFDKLIVRNNTSLSILIPLGPFLMAGGRWKRVIFFFYWQFLREVNSSYSVIFWHKKSIFVKSLCWKSYFLFHAPE